GRWALSRTPSWASADRDPRRRAGEVGGDGDAIAGGDADVLRDGLPERRASHPDQMAPRGEREVVDRRGSPGLAIDFYRAFRVGQEPRPRHRPRALGGLRTTAVVGRWASHPRRLVLRSRGVRLRRGLRA